MHWYFSLEFTTTLYVFKLILTSEFCTRIFPEQFLQHFLLYSFDFFCFMSQWPLKFLSILAHFQFEQNIQKEMLPTKWKLIFFINIVYQRRLHLPLEILRVIFIVYAYLFYLGMFRPKKCSEQKIPKGCVASVIGIRLVNDL